MRASAASAGRWKLALADHVLLPYRVGAYAESHLGGVSMTVRSILRLIAVAVLGIALGMPLAGAAQAFNPSRISLICQSASDPRASPLARAPWRT